MAHGGLAAFQRTEEVAGAHLAGFGDEAQKPESHRIGEGALSGRVELFDTKERGTFMDPAEENESGWAATAAGRWPLWDNFTLLLLLCGLLGVDWFARLMKGLV